MPRVPKSSGKGNLTRKDVGAADEIKIFEESRTRAGYLTQRAHIVSASERFKSPSKSPTKASRSRVQLPSPPRVDGLAHEDLTSRVRTLGRLRKKGKVHLIYFGFKIQINVLTKTSNDYMRDWKRDHRAEYLKRIVNLEAFPMPGPLCKRCNKAPGLFRCDHCTGRSIWCESCCVMIHQTSPFHYPKKWNGKCFKKVDLDTLGLTLFLGHGGDPCPLLLVVHTVPLDDPETDGWEDEIRTGFIGDRMQFVDTTGIFSRRIRWCRCADEHGNVVHPDLQLLDACIYPATSDRPTTAFTFNVLDEFMVDALECKTAAFTFVAKLRRLTNPLFPSSTPDIYPALMRCSRQYRNLKNIIRAGLAHDIDRVRTPGDLGLFCVTCPQVGKNVSAAEVVASKNPYLYRPQVVTDGNFKLDNLKMRNPGDDVRLSDGEMFFVGSVRYDEHVRTTPEKKQRSSCNNHRAVNETNTKRKDVDSTGIGACACARHGCFYPHSVVGFKVGEKQVNIDYAISEVLCRLPPEIKQTLLIYDISCQWILHWIERFQKGQYLFYRKDLELLAAVGKFHLGAHVLECFWEFSLNFIEGSGQVDGEILETLWASLDKVVGSTRSMSRAHRQEVLDDYMNDSNWKKMCGAVAALVGKMDRANEGFDTTQEAFQELSQRVGPEFIEKWEQEERAALAPGGIGRRIYRAETAKEPGLDEVCHQLTAEEQKSKGQLSGSVALITEGLNIEQAQCHLRKYVVSLGRHPTAAQKRNIIVKQDNLQKRYTKFEKSMTSFIRKHNRDETSDGELSTESEGEEEEESDHEGTIVDMSESEDEGHDWEDASDNITATGTQTMRLSLPSNLEQARLTHELRMTLQSQETIMREGQINDALRKLRLALGAKAWRLRNDVRDARGGKGKTRAWDGVKSKDTEVRRHVQIYTQAVAALRRMGAGAGWKPITKKDLMMSGDITEANRTGQRSSTLPWFWRLEDGGALGEMEASSEMTEFYRVNWLRAKARVARWGEEKAIVSNEMQWTVKSFQFLGDEWAKRVTNAGVDEQGLRAYAEKQVDTWHNFAGHAEAVFQSAQGTPKRDRWRKRGPEPMSSTAS
ncbi:hypothetical protein C8F04DRAFT_976706 [Mycena alexandri]|uniref:CxC2-like cysteine cluster KDZ transposase-associated domain-containing protein n=1 Tax=Mycena alexandri TaxID=1745969 RepID=A0AAD6S4G2_9AGAR|nr:hypothetical protein C8F04DRAFT_976706 [Mycena alexandri]